MTPQCIVFDIDDILFLSRDYYRSGIRAVHRYLQEEVGISGFGPRAWQRFEDLGPVDLFSETLRIMGHRPEETLLRTILDIYRGHEPAIGLLPDAQLCLERLYGDYALAALTAGPIPEQHGKVEKLGIDDFCTPLVYAGDHRGDRCPGPRAFQEMERRSGFPAAASLYITDNPMELLYAQEADFQALRIRRPGSLLEKVSTPQGFEEFSSLDEFSYWLVHQ